MKSSLFLITIRLFSKERFISQSVTLILICVSIWPQDHYIFLHVKVLNSGSQPEGRGTSAWFTCMKIYRFLLHQSQRVRLGQNQFTTGCTCTQSSILTHKSLLPSTKFTMGMLAAHVLLNLFGGENLKWQNFIFIDLASRLNFWACISITKRLSNYS